MDWLEKVIGWVIVPLLAFLGLLFIGKPFSRFYELRNEVSARLAECGNVRAQWKELPNDQREQLDVSPPQQKRLVEAQSVFRRIGSETKALAENEGLARGILRWRGYDPVKASQGLIGYCNSIDTFGSERHHFDQMIRTALRLSEIGEV